MRWNGVEWKGKTQAKTKGSGDDDDDLRGPRDVERAEATS